jgi:hypothetical protein
MRNWQETINLSFHTVPKKRPHPMVLRPPMNPSKQVPLVPRYFKSLLQFLLCDHEVEDNVACDEVTSSPKVHDFARYIE